MSGADPLEAAAKAASEISLTQFYIALCAWSDRRYTGRETENARGVVGDAAIEAIKLARTILTAPLLAETARLTRELEEAKSAHGQSYLRAVVDKDRAEAQLARARELLQAAMDCGTPRMLGGTETAKDIREFLAALKEAK